MTGTTPATNSRPPVGGGSSRLFELDLARAVALVAVALIHCAAWLTPADAPPQSGPLAAVIGIARVCVPAFVILSGLALAYVYRRAAPAPGPFLKKRLSRVALPWAAAVPVFLAVAVLRTGEVQDGHSFWSWLAFGPGHLYFLVLIAQLYLVFLILPTSRRGLLWFTVGAVALQLGLMVWHTYGLRPSGALVWPATYLAQEEAPFWIGYFAIGCLMGRHLDALLERWSLWPLAVAGAVLAGVMLMLEARHIPVLTWRQGSSAYLWPSRLPLTVLVVLSCLWCGRAWRQLLQRAGALIDLLSRHSLGIYVLHPLALLVAGPVTGGMPAPLRIPLLILVTLTWGAAAAVGGGWLLRTIVPALYGGHSRGQLTAAPLALARVQVLAGPLRPRPPQTRDSRG